MPRPTTAVRVVVLTGEGSTFCAGADLAGAAAADAGSFTEAGPRALVEVLEAMLRHPKPIVARVQGHVAGGGNGLVAAADLAVAAESAKFAFSEVRVGVAPAVISVVCLARMTPSHARELLLTGERVTAQRVLEAGLVTAVAEDDALDAVVASYVGQLLLGGPEASAHRRSCCAACRRCRRADAFAWTAELSATLFSGEEAREGMTRVPRAPAPGVGAAGAVLAALGGEVGRRVDVARVRAVVADLDDVAARRAARSPHGRAGRRRRPRRAAAPRGTPRAAADAVRVASSRHGRLGPAPRRRRAAAASSAAGSTRSPASTRTTSTSSSIAPSPAATAAYGPAYGGSSRSTTTPSGTPGWSDPRRRPARRGRARHRRCAAAAGHRG